MHGMGPATASGLPTSQLCAWRSSDTGRCGVGRFTCVCRSYSVCSDSDVNNNANSSGINSDSDSDVNNNANSSGIKIFIYLSFVN